MTVETAARRILIDGHVFPCQVGRSGPVAASGKREGDGRTPVGDWPIRAALLRPGTGFEPPDIPWRWTRATDGWSDDPADPAYNHPVALPHPFSAERLWRDDHCYDAILVLGYNDAPASAGSGSAIFLHIERGIPTEGCIAVSPAVMVRLLAGCDIGDIVAVR